jgi:hypothetical protein
VSPFKGVSPQHFIILQSFLTLCFISQPGGKIIRKSLNGGEDIMINNDEYLLFIAELDRLVDDYHKCPDIGLKERIQEDITLLAEVISH